MVKRTVKNILNYFGYDICHLPTQKTDRKRMELFRRFGIDLIFDIGANTGQYAQKMRRLGYEGEIVSFEPLPDAFEELTRVASNDPRWDAVNMAVGNKDGEIDLNVSKNSYSSSIMEMLPKHLESAPDSIYTGSIEVPICKTSSVVYTYS